MPTVLENIIEMAELVKETKKRTRLSETTIMRIVDMNLALAQRGTVNPLESGEEDEPEDEPTEDGEVIPFPEPHETGEPVEDDVLAAATEPEQE